MKPKTIATLTLASILSSTALADERWQEALDQLKGPWNKQGFTAEKFNRRAQETAVDEFLPKKYFEVRDDQGNLADVKIHLETSTPGPNEGALETQINTNIINQYNRAFTREDFRGYNMPSHWPLPTDPLIYGATFIKTVNLENGRVWFTYQKLNEDVIRRGSRPEPRVDDYVVDDEYTEDNPFGVRLSRGVRYTISIIENPTARPTTGLSLQRDVRFNGREPEPYYADFPSTMTIGGYECKVKITLPRSKTNAKPKIDRLDKCD